ncbi:MAG: hypothetical protein ACK4J0_01240 [Candidatus Anstonellaceae archaeon]
MKEKKKIEKKKKMKVVKPKPKKTTKKTKRIKLEVKDVERKIPQTIKESLNQIKEEMIEKEKPPSEIEIRKTPFVLDKIYLQSITFEIASMRQALDRIGQKLDKLEKELAAHRKGEG